MKRNNWIFSRLLLAVFTVLPGVLTLQAQDDGHVMTVELKDGTKVSVNTGDIKDISFAEGAITVSGGDLLHTIRNLSDSVKRIYNDYYNRFKSDTDEPGSIRKLTVEITENPMVSDGARAAVNTRGAVISTSSLNAFSMNYQDNRYNFSKSGDVWTSTPNEWPYGVDDDTPILFHAYNYGEYQYEGGYIYFEVDELANKQKDLLVAANTVSYDDNNGKVSLTFDHACAAVDFQVCLTNTLYGNLGAELTINRIELVKIKNSGKYYYSSGWDAVKGEATYTLTDSEFTLGNIAKSLSCGTLFMIPQTLGDEAGLNIHYTLNNEEKTTFVSMKDCQWEAGYQYTANIRLGSQQIK